MELRTLRHFSGRVNETFLAVLDGGEVPFQLVEACALPTHSEAVTRAQFSLLFRNTAPSPLPQQIYRLRHAASGAGEVFLVPIGRERDGYLYQAVFNQPGQHIAR
ncbi:MAG: hypothetical protein L0H63_13670 [Nitrococcus sp.]|nr:hypothetical protein [Nitrococcus sp.]